MDKHLRFLVNIPRLFPRLDDIAHLFHTQLLAIIIAKQPAPKITEVAKLIGECPGCLIKVIGRFQSRGILDQNLNLTDFEEEEVYGQV